MVLAADQKWPFVINLGNSIIGVAILTMPFCFKQCGILLGALVLFFCTWLTLASCQLLVKAGIMSHYQSYEFLAYHAYGAAGKFLVEMGMIGMQLGTLVAQIVVIGDLGPPIISQLFGFENTWSSRMYLIIFLCLFVGLPLGLMKDLRNVSRASTVCIIFYAVFVLYVLWLSSDNLWKGDWYAHVSLWRPQGFFQCLPIMSFSFGCQTQLFILYDALPEPSLQAIRGIIHSAVNLCCVAYLMVGFLSYVTFYHLDIPGDIITVFPATLGTHLIKLGFVMSIAITFPVIIYPCRASIYTLLFQKKSKHSDIVSGTYIPEHLFKGITITIVMSSMITGILIPNVEFVLGLNGAITGTLICYIFPALFFLRVSKPEGKTVAQIVLVLGVAILLISTFTTLYAQDHSRADPSNPQKVVQEAADRLQAQVKELPRDTLHDREAALQKPKEDANQANNRRLEPPYPFAPVDGVKADNPAKQAAADQHSGKEAQKAGDQLKEEKQKWRVVEPNKQEAVAPRPPDKVKGDESRVDQLQPARQDGGVANQAQAARQIQEAPNQPVVNVKRDVGEKNPPAAAGGQEALNPKQGVAQGGVDRARQGQGLVQGQDAVVGKDAAQPGNEAVKGPLPGQGGGVNQAPVLPQAQNVAVNQPHVLAQDQNVGVNQPHVLLQDQKVAAKQQPPQMAVEQGEGKAKPGIVAQAQGQLQQGGVGLLPQDAAAQQVPAQPQQPLDEAAVGRRQGGVVFQDREILAAERQGQAVQGQQGAGQQGNAVQNMQQQQQHQ